MPRKSSLPLSVQRMGNKKERTTVVLDETLLLNLKSYGLKNRMTLNQTIAYFCEEGLKREGFQPDKIPKVTVSY